MASWYDDAAQTACATHYPLGVASRTLPCGTRITFRHAGRTATATVQDRGPYADTDTRLFDLNPGLHAALACPDLCTLTYRLGGAP